MKLLITSLCLLFSVNLLAGNTGTQPPVKTLTLDMDKDGQQDTVYLLPSADYEESLEFDLWIKLSSEKEAVDSIYQFKNFVINMDAPGAAATGGSTDISSTFAGDLNVGDTLVVTIGDEGINSWKKNTYISYVDGKLKVVGYFSETVTGVASGVCSIDTNTGWIQKTEEMIPTHVDLSGIDLHKIVGVADQLDSLCF